MKKSLLPPVGHCVLRRYFFWSNKMEELKELTLEELLRKSIELEQAKRAKEREEANYYKLQSLVDKEGQEQAPKVE